MRVRVAPLLPTAPSGGDGSNAEGKFRILGDVTITGALTLTFEVILGMPLFLTETDAPVAIHKRALRGQTVEQKYSKWIQVADRSDTAQAAQGG